MNMKLRPVIALVTEIHDEQPIFGTVHSFCEELHHAATMIGGLFYVFSFKDFNTNEVKGYLFEDDQWKEAILPHPNVIYNRIHSRKLEQSDGFLRWKDQLSELRIPIFNDRFLSKWEVHEIISKQNLINPYLPVTTLFTKEQLEKMITEHPTIFLKPIQGSQGRNIIRITKNKEFILEISGLMEDYFVFTSLPKLLAFVDKQIDKRPYLVQQGVPLLTFQNRPLDFRVLCHRNVHDLWKVTSLVARASAEKQFVSNISYGGEIMKPLSALIPSFNQDTSLKLIAHMKELAVDIANILSNQSEGMICELGIDIGVDQQGKLWLIEVNSKPSKNFQIQPLNIRPSAIAIINYCTMLSFKQYRERNID